ncbi:MAG: metalloprotease [Candidatus Thermoplasmatota archaeon]|nr:metalloprotease [Candidatus Thermoplasmatota archaeon]
MQYVNSFDREELKDILAAVLILTAAFTIIYYRDIVFPRTELGYLILFGLALLTVLTAFLMHEMAHRFVARRLGGFGRFRIWFLGALLALVTSILGILFAAPGAVYVSGIYSAEANGKVSLAGPGTNMILAGIFYLIYLILSPVTSLAFLLGFVGALNSWYAIFNMIPFPPLDGYKVLVWDKRIYLIAIAVAVLLNIPGLYFGII